MQREWVRLFPEGDAEQRDLLGGKGANLAEMTNLGLPVPAGFTITTEACRAFLDSERMPDGLWDEIRAGLDEIERQMGRTFGDGANPLLVSVRSGAAVSMPGMMDTILNLGLNDETVAGVARETSEAFALDCYRRLLQMFGQVVLGIEAERFGTALDELKRGAGVEHDHELQPDQLRQVIDAFKAIYADEHQTVPTNPVDQLHRAVVAVFSSWNTQRAAAYREAHQIPANLGTAATVQAMVFGNRGPDSATGVAFTRDPSTGENGLFGEYLTNAQGEDVVAGIRTPEPLAAMAEDPLLHQAHGQLQAIAERLEHHYRDLQDLEFTVENGRLWMLQARSGQRTAQAAVAIAIDMEREGLIDRATAVNRLTAEHLEQLLHPRIDEDAAIETVATGLPASPGAATGQVVFDPDEAKRLGDRGTAVILVRDETTTDDFHGMVRSRGILTARGGMTSHAAVVARGMGQPAITGCTDLSIDEAAGEFRVGETVVAAGDEITLDGSTGRVILGSVPLIEPDLGGDVAALLTWADEFRSMAVRANADTPKDAARARQFGATGIGLCRTEHMFFQGERIDIVREMILAETHGARADALNRLEPLQVADFTGIFQAMDGLPVTIRTLDPPLHEFLPSNDEDVARLAEKLGISVTAIEGKIAALHEANPMLGHRGCRLGLTFPAVTTMQARAILRAALACAEDGIAVEPEIMIPLVADAEELRRQRTTVMETAEAVFAGAGRRVDFTVGTMIELPRAALLAGEIAAHADFFSYGTNDLTQTVFGFSRDDSGRFLPVYVERGILAADPFQILDRAGVGQLLEYATERGRKARPGLQLGLCGEHGGDPSSVAFCHELGLDYVSCSPFRVPIARLAAAHAALAGK